MSLADDLKLAQDSLVSAVSALDAASAAIRDAANEPTIPAEPILPVSVEIDSSSFKTDRILRVVLHY